MALKSSSVMIRDVRALTSSAVSSVGPLHGKRTFVLGWVETAPYGFPRWARWISFAVAIGPIECESGRPLPVRARWRWKCSRSVDVECSRRKRRFAIEGMLRFESESSGIRSFSPKRKRPCRLPTCQISIFVALLGPSLTPSRLRMLRRPSDGSELETLRSLPELEIAL